MVDLLRRVKAALGFDGHAGGMADDPGSDHQAVLERLAEQRRRLAALDAGIVPPQRPTWKGFRL